MNLITDIISAVNETIIPHPFETLFTSETEVVDELVRRREDQVLERDVHSFLNNSSALLARVEKPTAVLFRQVATPTHEILRFLDTAGRLSLEPLILEYFDDKFVGAGNPYKRALGKMPIYQHTGSDGRDIVRYITVIDFNAFMGKKIRDVCCIAGETLTEFHHDLLRREAHIDPSTICFDATEWFVEHGCQASNYYTPFMSIFIRDCILFENFEETNHLIPFVYDVVLPAFESIEKRFQRRPLIVRLLPKSEEQRLYWNSYPKRVADLVP